MSEQYRSLILTVGCITKSQKIIRISWKQDISKDLDFNERLMWILSYCVACIFQQNTRRDSCKSL